MNREQLVTQVSHNIDLPKSTVDRCLSGIVDAIKEALSEGDTAKIHKFGTFQIYERQSRMGINPQTKESIVIPATNKIKFKPSYFLDTIANGIKG